MVERAAWPEIERFAHSLKSAAGTLSDRTLAETADRVEKACQSGRIDRIGTLVKRLAEQLTRAVTAARQFSIGEETKPPPEAASDPDVETAIRELDDQLRRRSMKARKLFITFERAVRRPETDERLNAMAAALDRLDFAEAHRLMREIVSTVNVERRP
jgi:HPt (histidine-containing phosphotransfer) domain-containing protein